MKAPTKAEKRTLWLLLFGGLLSVGIFFFWFWTETLPGFWPLYLMLTVTISFKFLRLLHEWYHYAAMSVPTPPPLTREWKVDMLTTFCAGEPYEMVIETLKAMQAVQYPHTTYLCDEANDPYLQQVCAELGVVHVYRGEDKPNAKAGNVNYALTHHARGEIAIVLDPDHKPRPDFIDKVLPYFENDEIGFVQCVQAYSNQEESLIAKGAAEHTYHFYGPMMMSMNTYGTVQAIGANCTFRRAALDSIGGHAAGLSEDMHTAMRLHAKGWQSVYVPENLSRGLVPSTLGSFYKQQLKWSRGSFDLLFYKFPKLAKGYTGRQLLHYLTIPLYFLSGLIAAIDIFLPMLALVFARTPLFVDLTGMLQVTLPVLFFLMVNRLYVQKWTLERREQGLHFWGGVLMLSTWWVYLTGLIYTILKIKVPYIPTPKENEAADEWRICIPNLVVIGLGIASIVYGLNLDWSPYSWFMAGLVATNVIMLGVGVLMAQRKTISSVYYMLMHGSLSKPRVMWSDFRHDVIYRGFRSKKLVGTLAVMATATVLLGLVVPFKSTPRLYDIEAQKAFHRYEGFKWGMVISAEDVSRAEVQSQVHLASLSVPWDTMQQDWGAVFETAFMHGFIPLIQWQLPPDIQDSAWQQHLRGGGFDPYLRRMGYALNERRGASLVVLPPSEMGQDEEAEANFRQTWDYIYDFWEEENIIHVGWWWPLEAGPYPSRAQLAGLWLSCDGPHEALSFLPRHPLDSLPLYLGNWSTEQLQVNAPWDSLCSQYPQLTGVILADQPTDPLRAMQAFSQRHELRTAPLHPFPLPDQSNGKGPTWLGSPDEIPTERGTYCIEPDSGKFQLWVDGAPFVVKGVAYNPGHDWRDGYAPLIRENLENDFERIRAMGANVIRRYSPTIYDQNILNVAAEYDLKVLYGFWFDPKHDYYQNLEQIEAYKQEVLAGVKKFRDEEAVLAWAIGNETWGLIKQHTEYPYTERVRRAYLTMLEELAQEIHRLDPTRPVLTMLEHSDRLHHALWDINHYAPSIDIIGVNSYYRERIEILHGLMAKHNPGNPYLITEFGPKGYWDPELSTIGLLDRTWEQSDLQKAQDYYNQWKYFVEDRSDRNLGGVAFCWRDRMEGSLTWFGLVDFENRPKLGYYALQQAWRDTSYLDIAQFLDVRIEVEYYTPTVLSAYVVLPPHLQQRYSFQWKVVRDDYLEEVVSPEELPQKTETGGIELPHPPTAQDRLRIYLHMEDQQGNVITASHPITYRR